MIEEKFQTMMLGVQMSESLTDVEKEYIIELLGDQLRIEKECEAMHAG